MQYHGKQASQLVERLLSKNYEQGQTMEARKKQQQQLMRSVKYLEFFEALLDPRTGGISDAQIAEQIKGTEIASLVGEALTLD